MGRLRSRTSAAVICAGIVCATAPAASEATVYCVPNLAVDPSCQAADPAVQPMLTAAQNSAGVADTVRIGTGTFNVTNAGYTNANDDVQIIGAGTGATKLLLTDTTGTKTAFLFSAPATSILRDLTIEVGPNTDGNADRGLNLGASALARNLVVRGPDATNAIGLLTNDNAVFDDSVVDLKQGNASTNIGVRHLGGTARITDSTIIADQGVGTNGTSGGSVTVERSTVVATVGLTNQGATDPVHAKNVVVDLGTVDGAVGLQSENGNEGSTTMTVTGDHLTIVGGGDDSFGVRSIGDSNGGPPDPFGGVPGDTVNDGELGDVTLSNSVISGPETSVLVGADRGEAANAVLSYVSVDTAPVEDDDLSDGDASGNATLTQSNVTTNANPGFVNAGSGNYHILAASPLIDAGDPIAPVPGALDIDGDPRALDGIFDCTVQARRDIGADEFVGSQGVPDACTITPVNPSTFNQVKPGPGPTQPAKKCKKAKKKPRGSVAAKKCKRKKRR